jgi:metallo-beta-lactamase family protein
MRIQFIGAAGGTITGSCSLLHHTASNIKFLVDCGLAQGEGHTEAHNEGDFPFDASEIRFVLLTHAHLDHCGLLPRLYREGFKGEVYCTEATAQLAKLSLLDGAKYPGSMFTQDEVKEVRFTPVEGRIEKSKWMPVAQNLTVSFQRTAHIVGAASIIIKWQSEDSQIRHLVMSGDLGNNTKGNLYQSLLGHRKGLFGHPDFIVVESTYGARDRLPEYKSFEGRIEAWHSLIQREVFGQKASLIIPAFALQRTHEVLLDIVMTLTRHYSSAAPLVPCLTPNRFYEPFQDGTWLSGTQAAIELAIAEQPSHEQSKWLDSITTVKGDKKRFCLTPNSQCTVDDLAELAYKTHAPFPVDVVLDARLARAMGEVLRNALSQRRPGKPEEFAYRNPELKQQLQLEDDEAVDQLLADLLNSPERGEVTIPLGPHQIRFCKEFKMPGSFERAKRGLILITGAGMCDGGPVVEHFDYVISNRIENVLVQVGYMAPASMGGRVIQAIKSLEQGKSFEPFELKQRTVAPDNLMLRAADMSAFYSGHADQASLLDFVMEVDGEPAFGHLPRPAKVFINHGSAGYVLLLRRMCQLPISTWKFLMGGASIDWAILPSSLITAVAHP